MATVPRSRTRHPAATPYTSFFHSLDVQRTTDLARHLLPNDYTSSTPASVDGFGLGVGVGFIEDGVQQIESTGLDSKLRGKRKRKRMGGDDPENEEVLGRGLLGIEQTSPSQRSVHGDATTHESHNLDSVRNSAKRYHLQLSTLWPLPPSDLPPLLSTSTLSSELLPIATSLIRKRRLHFPPPRKQGMKQKYPRVPIDLDKVRREGIWVMGDDLGNGTKRWNKYPKAVREALMVREQALHARQIGNGEEGLDEDGKEGDDNDDDDDDNDNDKQEDEVLMDHGTEDDSSNNDNNSDENQERLYKRRSSRNTVDSQASSNQQRKKSHNHNHNHDDGIVLPRNLAHDLTIWLNNILLELALAMPEVTGKEFVDLHPLDWKSMVDVVAIKDQRDLKVALAAEERLSKLYGSRPYAEDHREALISRHKSLHTSRLATLAMEAELCPDSSSGFSPLGPPKPVIVKERKKWTRKATVPVTENGASEGAPPMKRKRGRPRKNPQVD